MLYRSTKRVRFTVANSMMSQLPLDLELPQNFDEEDFLVSSCNEFAWKSLERWDELGAACQMLKGPYASGKTHLCHIWAARNSATILESFHLDTETDPRELFRFSQNLVIENIEQIRNESYLFHVLNYLKHNRLNRLLLTLGSDCSWESFTLADLRSRLQALPQAEIQSPDESLMVALVTKYFHDRQITINRKTLNYIVLHSERSFAGLSDFLFHIDNAALIRKKAVNVDLISDLLKETRL